jgi:hypothetical protein
VQVGNEPAAPVVVLVEVHAVDGTHDAVGDEAGQAALDGRVQGRAGRVAEEVLADGAVGAGDRDVVSGVTEAEKARARLVLAQR